MNPVGSVGKHKNELKQIDVITGVLRDGGSRKESRGGMGMGAEKWWLEMEMYI